MNEFGIEYDGALNELAYLGPLPEVRLLFFELFISFKRYLGVGKVNSNSDR